MNKYDMYDHEPHRRKRSWFDLIAQAVLYGLPILWLVLCLWKDLR